MESDDSMSVLLPMVSLMLLLVFAGGLWFLRTRNQLRGASQSFLARMLLQEQETITRLDLERGEAQAERWKCSVCEFSNAMDRPTCVLCGTKNAKYARQVSDREELPRLKHSIAGRDERLSSASSVTMLARPSLQRSSILSAGTRASLRPLRLSTLNPRQKYARRRKEWVRCLGEDGESAFWTRADVAAATRRLTVVNTTGANQGGHRISVGFVTHMVRRASMMGDIGRLTFAEASQLDAAETISGYKLSARELELLDRVSRLPFPKKYAWFLERMGALLRPWEEGRIKLRVQREHILVESMEQLLGIQPEHIHFPLRIEFVGEAGIDAGGLQREWFSILFGRLLDDELGLFMTCHRHTQAVAINPHSEDCTADHLLYFRGIGRLLGRALLEGQTMQARLCLPILKHFLGTPITFSDLQYVDPEVYTSMMWIRENDGVDALELTFSVTELRADDEVVTVDLVPDGRDKAVTDANKMEFLHLKLRYLMLGRYAPQLQALSLGLFEVIPQEALLVFDYQELELVLCGMPEIDLADWKRNTVVAPSFGDTPLVVDWFWEILKGFTEDERARFLQFSTGSSRVPVQGFKGLTSYDGRICPFSLRPLPNQTRGFPKVHTCFNRVELPLYTDKAEMEAALSAVLDMEWTEFSEE
ncbi:putative HECT E3 ubiquitin ligase [Phytophthora cinnamomi]|uniref:putative HECT E3 ubiquitin ligase n=1 Tax=Phytophthora cinnamomi TaxID=4785 RepID=UPI0035594CA6|nr:putative HECT E3 ubiquitin ligase [Phytophthora cinnamomi]